MTTNIKSLLKSVFISSLLFAHIGQAASVDKVFYSANGNMYLGQWKQSIADSIMPDYFDAIDYRAQNQTITSKPINTVVSFSEFNLASVNHFQYEILGAESLNLINSSSRLAFSFDSEIVQASDIALNTVLNAPRFQTLNYKNNRPEFINQQLYAPGYTFSRGTSSLGLAAVFVQQNFIDDTFGFMTLESQQSSAIYNDPILYETTRGLGYRVNFSQQLPFAALAKPILVKLEYSSKIEMNEFDTFGTSYSQAGDYDIPENYTFSVDVPVSNSNILNLKTQNIRYSDIAANLHSGFSRDFLAIMSSPVRPSFEWDDLTVYSFEFKHLVSESLSWQVGVTSSQQAPTISRTLNNIINNDTASFSYKMGVARDFAGGQLDLFATYADKPVFIGRTEFGRFLDDNLDKHIEAGLSWKHSF